MAGCVRAPGRTARLIGCARCCRRPLTRVIDDIVDAGYGDVTPPDKASRWQSWNVCTRSTPRTKGDSWWLRSAIVWHKPSPMPESVRDRPTSAYEMIFLLAKRPRYFYDAEAIREERISKG